MTRCACMCMRVGWVKWRRAHDTAVNHKPGGRHTASGIARARVSWRVHEESGRVAAGLGLERCRGCMYSSMMEHDRGGTDQRLRQRGEDSTDGVWRSGWGRDGGIRSSAAFPDHRVLVCVLTVYTTLPPPAPYCPFYPFYSYCPYCPFCPFYPLTHTHTHTHMLT